MKYQIVEREMPTGRKFFAQSRARWWSGFDTMVTGPTEGAYAIFRTMEEARAFLSNYIITGLPLQDRYEERAEVRIVHRFP